MTHNAIHGHEQQKHWNGKRYNTKPSVRNRTKIWKMIYRLWEWKHTRALSIIRYYKSFGPMGANGLEQIHSTINNVTPWVKVEGVGIKRLAAVAAIQQLAVLKRRLQNILVTNKAKLYKEFPEDVKMLQEMQQVVTEIRGFDEFHERYDELNQNLLYYEDASIHYQDYVDDLNPKAALDQRTPLRLRDRQKIREFVDEHMEEMAENGGFIPSVADLIPLKKKLRKVIHLKELKHITHSYFMEPDQSDNSDSDSDSDYDTDDEYQTYRKQLSSKQKKLSELSHIFYPFYLFCLFYLFYLFQIFWLL